MDLFKVMRMANKIWIKEIGEMSTAAVARMDAHGYKHRAKSLEHWNRRLNTWHKNTAIIEEELGVDHELI